MDFELLNYFIRYLPFHVQKDTLFLRLPGCERDIFNLHEMPLTDDPLKILDFFGYDTTIEYTKLSQSNIFVYLTNSTKLDPAFICHDGFKGPHAKNNIHKKFNQHLVCEYQHLKKHRPHQDVCEKWIVDAIKYFNKLNEFNTYQSQKAIIDKALQFHVATDKDTRKGYDRFVLLHGVYTVASMTRLQFEDAWVKFKRENWSSLKVIEN
jgi:hypothetical protein